MLLVGLILIIWGSDSRCSVRLRLTALSDTLPNSDLACGPVDPGVFLGRILAMHGLQWFVPVMTVSLARGLMLSL